MLTRLMLENERYTGTVTLLDSATRHFEYQMKECLPPIITESEVRVVQAEKKKRSYHHR
jgi:site-specific DNA recombinase